MCKTFCHRLISSPFDSEHGIKLSIEAPFEMNHKLNVLREPVLRQYYGMDKVCDNSFKNIVFRQSYGLGAGSACRSVGTMINNAVTRSMPDELCWLGQQLHKVIFSYPNNSLLYDVRRNNHPIIDDSFNHCTVLLYYSIDGVKMQSTLSKHCDCTFNKQGVFQKNHNAQKENNVTACYTIGDSRVLKFFLRRINKFQTENKKYKWEEKNTSVKDVILEEGDLMVIHPNDERPFPIEDNHHTMLYQIQHGEVTVDDDKFSIGFLFRTVDNIQAYHRTTNNLLPAKKPKNIKNKKHYEKCLSQLEDAEEMENIHTKIKTAFIDRVYK